MKKILFFLLLSSFTLAFCQEKAYYYEIPETPEKYTPENMAARMIDGLGFRYFWATADLKESDLDFKPSADARNTRYTLEHIYDLCNIVKHTALNQSYKKDELLETYSFKVLREKTLENLQLASEALKKQNVELEKLDMVFANQNGKSTSYSFWFLINGPLSDALWHVGQVVSFRRASGNPIPSGVNVLQGKKNN
jgi:hypothetical protein